jgi:hypothetical protein
MCVCVCMCVCICVCPSIAGLPCRIEYIDRTLSMGGCSYHDFGVDDDTTRTPIYLLYRPGHYDILYV